MDDRRGNLRVGLRVGSVTARVIIYKVKMAVVSGSRLGWTG
jgi:hypothetical protein